MRAPSEPRLRPLPAGRRFVGFALAWGLLLGATPGLLTDDGPWFLAVLGVGLFGAIAVRPAPAGNGRRALLVTWLANALGTAGSMAWIWFVVPPGLLWVGLGMGLYVTFGALAMKRLVRRLSPGAACALGWAAFEVARTVLPPPFGLGWFLLGYHAHATPWLLGGARVFGVEGLGFALAALGGVVTDTLLLRGPTRQTLGLAAGSVVAVLLAGGLVPAPETEPGPRLLLVQPAISQEIKQSEAFEDATEVAGRLTLEALARESEPVDLVAWGETMLPIDLVEPEVDAALAAGAEAPPWWGEPISRRLAGWRSLEEAVLRRGLLARLPAGTSFLTGAIVIGAEPGRIVRRNAVVLYDPEHRRGRPAAKRFLVPGAESALGLERFDWVRGLAWRAMQYVPDFVPARETGVLSLPTHAGRPVRLAVGVCFDNAFPEVFTEPVAAGPVDLLLVASNEAWYHDSFEMDQMLAFSAVIAASTGRPLVRVTNSGVSAVFGADGREVDRLRVEGVDRGRRGTLAVRVPVPRDPSSAPPYPALRPLLRTALLLLLALFLVRTRRRAIAPGEQG